MTDLKRLEYLVFQTIDQVANEIQDQLPTNISIDRSKLRKTGRRLVYEIVSEHLAQRKILLTDEEKRSTTKVGEILDLEHERNIIESYLRKGLRIPHPQATQNAYSSK